MPGSVKSTLGNEQKWRLTKNFHLIEWSTSSGIMGIMDLSTIPHPDGTFENVRHHMKD